MEVPNEVSCCPMNPVREGRRELAIFMTAFCTLRCRYCDIHSDAVRGAASRRIEPTVLSQIFDYVDAANVKKVLLTGGEPFVSMSLTDVMDGLDDRGVKYSVSTNGTMLNEEVVRELVARPFCDHLNMSFDSLDPDVNDEIRGPDDHERMLRAMDLCDEYGLAYHVQVTVTNKTLPTTAATIDYLLTHTMIDKVKVIPVAEYGHQASALSVDGLSMRTLERLWEIYTIFWPDKVIFRRVPISGLPLGGCNASPDALTVDYRGDVYICAWGLVPHLLLGNVARHSPEELRERAEDKLARLRVGRRCNQTDCAKKGTDKSCGLGCPIVALTAEGTMMASDHVCQTGFDPAHVPPDRHSA